MKKLFITLLLFTAFGVTAVQTFADETEVQQTTLLKGEAAFNWLDMSQIERDTIIQNYKNIVFDNDTVYKYKRKEFKSIHKDFVKDSSFKYHYMEAKEGITETAEYKISAFFSGKILISYAIQYKKNPKTVYYYDAFGNLKYVDMISDNYPDFPYWSKQYKINGEMISAIYFLSHDMQYMYEPDGKFQGVWFMDKMYDRHAKQTLTRTNW